MVWGVVLPPLQIGPRSTLRRFGISSRAWQGWPAVSPTRSFAERATPAVAALCLERGFPALFPVGLGMFRGEDQRVEGRRGQLWSLECWAQSAFGVVQACEVDRQRPGTSGIVSADGGSTRDSLSASKAGRRQAARRTAAVSELKDIPKRELALYPRVSRGAVSYFWTRSWKLCRRLARWTLQTRLGFSTSSTNSLNSAGASQGSLANGASSQRPARRSGSAPVPPWDESTGLGVSRVMATIRRPTRLDLGQDDPGENHPLKDRLRVIRRRWRLRGRGRSRLRSASSRSRGSRGHGGGRLRRRSIGRQAVGEVGNRRATAGREGRRREEGPTKMSGRERRLARNQRWQRRKAGV